ncbi:Na+/H+ antiporter subunit G [Kushneria phosphatilytica]|uniref:Na+/H+ antiporter subunit G n=1 Tax=Kushneria phosphatilytica TaxID=657387 RepID=UPI000B027DE9|nr:Na+/H+ antiporter subunit G [Kushneria phosphatilytica]
MMFMPEWLVPWLEGLIALLLVAGGIFAVIGALGLLRFRDFFQRLHGPAKNSTLGVGCTLLASMLFFWVQTGDPSGREILITLFVMITTPVSAHLLTMTGMHHRLQRTEQTQGEPYELGSERDR